MFLWFRASWASPGRSFSRGTTTEQTFDKQSLNLARGLFTGCDNLVREFSLEGDLKAQSVICQFIKFCCEAHIALNPRGQDGEARVPCW